MSSTSTTSKVDATVQEQLGPPLQLAGRGRALQRPHRGRADGDDAVGRRGTPPTSPRARGSARCAWGGRAGRRRDRLERVQADGELDRVDGDPRRGEPLEQLRGEVQPGRRRGGRARLPGIHGLVTLGPIEAGRDVGRQRHLADPVERLQRSIGAEARRERVAGRRAPDDRGDRRAVGRRAAPRRARSRRAGRTSASHVVDPVASSSSTSTAPPVARRRRRPRRQHPGVVDDDDVAGAQEIGKVGDRPVVGRRAPPVDEQPGSVARLDRHLGDALRRQLVVELLQPHAVTATGYECATICARDDQARRAGGDRRRR